MYQANGLKWANAPRTTTVNILILSFNFNHHLEGRSLDVWTEIKLCSMLFGTTGTEGRRWQGRIWKTTRHIFRDWCATVMSLEINWKPEVWRWRLQIALQWLQSVYQYQRTVRVRIILVLACNICARTPLSLLWRNYMHLHYLYSFNPSIGDYAFMPPTHTTTSIYYHLSLFKVSTIFSV